MRLEPWGFVVLASGPIPPVIPPRGAHTSQPGEYSQNHDKPGQNQMPKLIPLSEGATMAGMSVRTAERAAERGEFVALYELPGGHRRVDLYELEEWIASRRIDNNQPKEATQ